MSVVTKDRVRYESRRLADRIADGVYEGLEAAGALSETAHPLRARAREAIAREIEDVLEGLLDIDRSSSVADRWRALRLGEPR